MLLHPSRLGRIVLLFLLSLLVVSCASLPSSATTIPVPTQTQDQLAAPLTYTYQVVQRYPHDTMAWTQGLIYIGNDQFYESTGQYERSSLREVTMTPTGVVVRQVGLGDPRLYGEGIALVGDTIVMLTWQNCRGLLFQRSDFRQIGHFTYPQVGDVCAMQGWGLAYDGKELIMSDGTSLLSFVDPATTISSGRLMITRQVQVTRQGIPVTMLNELEYINGKIFANIWQTNLIVQIDPTTGVVVGEIDLSGLLNPAEQATADVLNGIAYDAVGDRFFVTGKLWPALFEIDLEPPISYRIDLSSMIKG